MKRPGGIGGNELDVDRHAAANRRIAVGGAGPQDVGEAPVPQVDVEAQVDESGPRHFGPGDTLQPLQAPGQEPGEVAGLHAGRLGQHHGGVGGDVAVPRLARRLHADPRAVEALREAALAGQTADDFHQIVAQAG